MQSSNLKTRALIVVKAGEKTYDARVVEKTVGPLKPDQVLVNIRAAAFNHRDLWIRKGQYGGIAEGTTFGSDGCGIIVDSATKDDPLLNKRVFLIPMVGWQSSPKGPENKQGFGILGGVKFPGNGTMTGLVAIDRSQVLEAPDHLTDEQVAAWPLAAITAWRAVVVKAQVTKGSNVLITGVGGGVALTALQICLGLGANVYVTSGDPRKIEKAVGLGAKGGVNYKSDKWPEELQALLGGGLLDTIVDSAGGDIMTKTNKMMKTGAIVSCYGMTAVPSITFTMRDVLKNIELKGSTMGSRDELVEATKFLAEKKIVPVVSEVLSGLDEAEKGFQHMEERTQFGKIVIKIEENHSKL